MNRFTRRLLAVIACMIALGSAAAIGASVRASMETDDDTIRAKRIILQDDEGNEYVIQGGNGLEIHGPGEAFIRIVSIRDLVMLGLLHTDNEPENSISLMLHGDRIPEVLVTDSTGAIRGNGP